MKFNFKFKFRLKHEITKQDRSHERDRYRKWDWILSSNSHAHPAFLQDEVWAPAEMISLATGVLPIGCASRPWIFRLACCRACRVRSTCTSSDHLIVLCLQYPTLAFYDFIYTFNASLSSRQLFSCDLIPSRILERCWIWACFPSDGIRQRCRTHLNSGLCHAGVDGNAVGICSASWLA